MGCYQVRSDYAVHCTVSGLSTTNSKQVKNLGHGKVRKWRTSRKIQRRKLATSAALRRKTESLAINAASTNLTVPCNKSDRTKGFSTNQSEYDSKGKLRKVRRQPGKAVSAPGRIKRRCITGRRVCPLFDTVWWRVVLDEAHNIKDRLSNTHRACADLAARHRWCLTGTPLQVAAVI